jgi:hypothetical protein
MMFLVYCIMQWCCHFHPCCLILIVFTNSFDSISVQNMMTLLLLLIKTSVTWFILIHIDTLCERASLSCEFAEFLDVSTLCSNPNPQQNCQIIWVRKTHCTNIARKCHCRLLCRVGGSQKAVGDPSILCWTWHGKRLPAQITLYCGKS